VASWNSWQPPGSCPRQASPEVGTPRCFCVSRTRRATRLARGKPITGFFPNTELIATAGPLAFPCEDGDPVELVDDSTLVAAVDRKHYGRTNRPVTNAQGYITLPGLIPGALYRMSFVGPNGRTAHRDFTVKPGETIDLGEILVKTR
jgi:hypothetical protein